MKNFDQIKMSIQSAMVPTEDKQVMIDIFAEVTDENLEEIAELFMKKPEWVSIFNENRKKKMEAYKTGDESLWTELIEQEKKYVQDLTFGLD
jgi:uncharacterized pyridoxamine 5'-phosphate oxidase family protein